MGAEDQVLALQPEQAAELAPVQFIGKEEVLEATKILQEYKQGKANIEDRIVENERWYKMRHWEYVRRKQKRTEEAEPSSAWLFNSLANKHADAMDNYPEPNVLPREEGDEQDAEMLSSIVPVVMERNDYEETYSRAWWYKLKQGAVPYGVFWDSSKGNGLGDISIKKLDILNLFWQPGITDIQDGENFFIVATVPQDTLKAQYPQLKNMETTTLTVTEYIHDENISTQDKAVVVDWYYKKRDGSGRTILHYAKFVGSEVLFATENEPKAYPNGLYDHGKYPVIMDVLFPEEDMPTGIGYIDIMKEPQLYIDKLDQIIMLNAFRAGKSRWFVNPSAGVNEEEFSDLSKDFVHTSASLDDRNVKEIVSNPLPAFISTHKQLKIEELKETSGNRDFSQGGSAGGVTAAAAIAALQEAGNKLSRDMIKGSYRAHKNVTYMVIELIRQFYDEARSFRIVGEKGAVEYMQYSNQRIKAQPIPLAYQGQEQASRVPVFDIVVKPQKSNPFSTNAQNELAVQLYQMGFFDPARADMTLTAMELMQFDGKQKIAQKIAENGGMFQQLQQMMALVTQLTGGGQTPGGPHQATGSQKPAAKGTDAQTMSRATSNANQSYGEKLAAR